MKYFFYSFLYREISMTILCMGVFCVGTSPPHAPPKANDSRITPLDAIAFERHRLRPCSHGIGRGLGADNGIKPRLGSCA